MSKIMDLIQREYDITLKNYESENLDDYDDPSYHQSYYDTKMETLLMCMDIIRREEK